MPSSPQPSNHQLALLRCSARQASHSNLHPPASNRQSSNLQHLRFPVFSPLTSQPSAEGRCRHVSWPSRGKLADLGGALGGALRGPVTISVVGLAGRARCHRCHRRCRFGCTRLGFHNFGLAWLVVGGLVLVARCLPGMLRGSEIPPNRPGLVQCCAVACRTPEFY